MRYIQMICLAVLLSGCGLLTLPTIISPKPPDTRYQYHELLENNPTAVTVGDKVVVVQNQRREVSANYVNQEKPLNWWQRLCNKLANLSILTVLIAVGLLATGTTAPFIWLFQRYLAVKKTAKQIIKSVDEAKVLETNNELKTRLSSNLDTDAKRLVDDLKRS